MNAVRLLSAGSIVASIGCASKAPPLPASTESHGDVARAATRAHPKFASIRKCTEAPKCDDGSCARACEANDGDACFALFCAAADPLTQVELARAGCRVQHPAACNDLGFRYDHGQGVDEDLPRARALFQQSCELGDGAGCNNLGIVLATGRGGPKDLVRSVDVYRRGCDLGASVACTHLGRAYDKGTGVDRDPARATVAWRRGCDDDDGGGCNDLGWAFDHGAGVTEDRPRAKELFEKACDLGDARGCDNLGLIFQTAAGDRQLARAAVLFKQACDKGLDEACARAAAVVSLLQRACLAKRGEACALVKELEPAGR